MKRRPIRTISPYARALRANQTEAERTFWAAVRDRRLAGFKFKRQVTLGPYIADFVCAEARLVVELDGSQHADAANYDAARTAHLTALGYHVLRFWNNELTTNFNGVMEAVAWHLAARTR